jgi:hypothetical protein
VGDRSQEDQELEAHEIAAGRVAELRTESYEHLVASYLGGTVHSDIVGATGSHYDVEVQAFWENPRLPATLVVQVAVDWPQRGSRRPAIGEFLVSPDGGIVSKSEPEWFRELDGLQRPALYVLYLGAWVGTGQRDWSDA